MHRNPEKISAGRPTVLLLLLLNAIILEEGYVAHEKWYWLLYITIPLLLVSILLFYRRPSRLPVKSNFRSYKYQYMAGLIAAGTLAAAIAAF